jgi:hypothetical protein
VRRSLWVLRSLLVFGSLLVLWSLWVLRSRVRGIVVAVGAISNLP